MDCKVFLLLPQDLDEESVLNSLHQDGCPVLEKSDPDSILYLSSHAKTLKKGEGKSKTTAMSFMEYVLSLYRSYNLSANERNLVLSCDDTMLAMQLCLAQRNKELRGEFHVDLSTVIEYHKMLVQQLLTSSEHEALHNSEAEDVSKRYHQFLLENNVTDFAQVLAAVREEMKNNEDLKSTVKKQTLVVLNRPANVIEEKILGFLCEGKAVCELSCEVPLDGALENETLHLISRETSIANYLSKCIAATPNSPKSVTELYAEKIYLSYLSLLVNSRSEISLARILNVPNRDLDHKAFTRLKKAAGEKRMPMFQTAMSFVMRIRLGGKGYAPDVNNPLNQDVKGLSEFISLMHKLQCVIEEVNDASSAVKRVINMIKATILRCKDNHLRPASIEAVAERLKQEAQEAVSTEETKSLVSPSRSASSGGSLLGRKTLRVMRHLLDHYSSQSSTTSLTSVTDVITSQKTPVRIHSIMDQFRSPEECEELDSSLHQSLGDRLKNKFQDQNKNVGIPRYQSHMDWAPNTVPDWNTKEAPSPVLECLPRNTIVHAGNCHKTGNRARKLIDTINDQENIQTESSQTDSDGSVCKKVPNNDNSSKEKRKRNERENSPQKSNAKRAKIQEKVTKPKSKTAPKKKQIPILQGQKTLSHFFRM